MNALTMKKVATLIFFVLLISFGTLCKGAVSTDIDSPLKAAIFYFPSPPVMRCLNHSDIPGSFRKAIVYRKIKLAKDDYIEQNITIDIELGDKKEQKFILSENLIHKGKTIPLEIKNTDFFDSKKGKSIKPKLYLFGLEELIGLQRKIHFMDTLGEQELDYEVFLKTTKGKIGELPYTIELFGQDKVVNKEIKYFLNGEGRVGEDEITVLGEEAKKDYYELNEKYGPFEIETTIKVYD